LGVFSLRLCVARYFCYVKKTLRQNGYLSLAAGMQIVFFAVVGDFVHALRQLVFDGAWTIVEGFLGFLVLLALVVLYRKVFKHTKF